MKARTHKAWTLRKILQRVKAGFGRGQLSSYIPWISVRDISSIGTSTRMWSPKTGRKMQFLSNIERDMFLIAEFREDFIDYWEQFPLDRVHTEAAATQLGVRHPTYIGTNLLVVMTVDGVLTLRNGDQAVRRAIDCKHSDALSDARTREKLEISRFACERSGMRYHLVTQLHTPAQVVKNILWVRSGFRKRGELEPVQGAFEAWPMRMHRDLLQQRGAPDGLLLPLNRYCELFEKRNGLPRGLGLRCIKLLVWQHLVVFDMEVREPAFLRLGALTLLPAKTWVHIKQQVA